MPVNLVGVAISTAVFPSLTDRLNENRKDLFRKELQQAIRVIAWIALPIAVITFFGRGYVVSFIKNGGDALMAGILGALVVAILFRTMYHIASRSFYAQQDTKTPFYASVFAIALNIFLAIWFTQSLDLGAYGLAYAQSIVAVFEVIVLVIIIHRRIEGGLIDKYLVSALLRMASAAGFMALATYATVQVLQLQRDDMSLSSTVPKFVAIVAVSAIVYVLISSRMGLSEADVVLKRANQIIFSKRR
jgi:putative peptidoglycan lipid II flippase